MTNSTTPVVRNAVVGAVRMAFDLWVGAWIEFPYEAQDGDEVECNLENTMNGVTEELGEISSRVFEAIIEAGASSAEIKEALKGWVNFEGTAHEQIIDFLKGIEADIPSEEIQSLFE